MRILNYRKSGQPFWNMLTIAPMADVDGTSRFFIGVQVGPPPCLAAFRNVASLVVGGALPAAVLTSQAHFLSMCVRQRVDGVFLMRVFI